MRTPSILLKAFQCETSRTLVELLTRMSFCEIHPQTNPPPLTLTDKQTNQKAEI